jgi:hypothetical protein
MSTSTFCYDDLTIGVDSSDAAVLHWTEEFLRPSFTLAAGRAADATVALVADERAFNDALASRAESVAREIACFRLDRGTVRLPTWRSPRWAGVLLFDERERVIYRKLPAGNRVEVLTLPANLHARFALMRVVRELAMNRCATGHRLVVHGAALARGDSGLVIAGPKEAGKTSLLIHCLRDPTARFVANDRVVVDLDRPEPGLRGMPTIVSIRPGTLASFPELKRAVQQAGYDHRLALAETAERARVLREGHAANVSPAQFCRLLGVEMRDQVSAAALLFPRVSAAQDGIHLQPLAAEAAVHRLEESLFAAGVVDGEEPLFQVGPNVALGTGDRRRLCAALARRLPCFDVQLGSGAYVEAAAATRLLDRVAEVTSAS